MINKEKEYECFNCGSYYNLGSIYNTNRCPYCGTKILNKPIPPENRIVRE